MTRAQIEARIAQLEKARDAAQADAYAWQGAINDCRFWLDEIAKSERPAAAPEVVADRAAIKAAE